MFKNPVKLLSGSFGYLKLPVQTYGLSWTLRGPVSMYTVLVTQLKVGASYERF